MPTVTNKRTVMTLFSDPECIYSHRVRLVLAEKNITVDIIDTDPLDLPEDVAEANPYGTLPTLIDRDLALYDSRIIMEYLDERYPHPPLLPIDPVSRANTRLYLHRIEKDWYSLLGEFDKGEKSAAKARKTLRDSLAASAEVFSAKPFFLSDEFSLVDASVAPILWRLDYYRIELPTQAKPVLQYADRLFKRDSFKASLTEAEKEMRD